MTSEQTDNTATELSAAERFKASLATLQTLQDDGWSDMSATTEASKAAIMSQKVFENAIFRGTASADDRSKYTELSKTFRSLMSSTPQFTGISPSSTGTTD